MKRALLAVSFGTSYRETLEKKRTLALELGIRRFFLLYPEIADLWEVPSQEG